MTTGAREGEPSLPYDRRDAAADGSRPIVVPLSIRTTAEPGPLGRVGSTVAWSLHGLTFVADEPFSIGQAVWLDVLLENGRGPRDCRAIIRRSSPSIGSEGGYEIDVEFEDPSVALTAMLRLHTYSRVAGIGFQMRIQVAGGTGALTVRLAGMVDEAMQRAFELGIDEIRRGGRTRVVIECDRMVHMNSASVGYLLGLHHSVRSRAGILVLAAPSRAMRKLITFMGLEGILPIAGTVAEAANLCLRHETAAGR